MSLGFECLILGLLWTQGTSQGGLTPPWLGCEAALVVDFIIRHKYSFR